MIVKLVLVSNPYARNLVHQIPELMIWRSIPTHKPEISLVKLVIVDLVLISKPVRSKSRLGIADLASVCNPYTWNLAL